jgi:hypothetical protein
LSVIFKVASCVRTSSMYETGISFPSKRKRAWPDIVKDQFVPDDLN